MISKATQYFLDKSRFNIKDNEYKRLQWFYLFGEMKRDGKDITTEFILHGKFQNVKAKVISKANGVLAGQEEVEWFLSELGLNQTWNKKDGEKLKNGDTVFEIEGDVAIILKAERIILNFLGRLSGISSMTSDFVSKVPKSVLICPTRKTQWGLLDKKACVIGGGGTHRINLESAILIKENHMLLCDEMKEIISIEEKRIIKDYNPKFFEIEVENNNEFFKAYEYLLGFKDIQGVIMFDDFNAEDIKKIIKIDLYKNSKLLYEASGGINICNIEEYGNTGVDIISIGALTHSVKNFDFSMQVKNN